MLEGIESMFSEMGPMLKRLKKPEYEKRVPYFRERYGHYIDEMLGSINNSEDKAAEATNMARVMCDAVYEHYTNNGKIKSYKQVDLNFFMVYYVFPSILLTEDENARLLCDSIKDTWNHTFAKTNIGYLDYETIHKSFKNKIFGIF